MRKTILMFINGFGIEKNGSANLYSPTLMPNLDNMTREYLFGSLNTSVGDYNNGYRIFSIPDKNKHDEDEIDKLIFEKQLVNNKVLQSVRDSLTAENKLHVFYMINDDSKWSQIREYLKIINANKDKKVFVHFIMTGASTASYGSISKIISKVSFETSDYCKIGFLVGKNKINTDDVLRCFYKELGEHWNESNKKIEILKKEVVNPEDAGVFIINGGFALQEGDSIPFLNYEEIEMDRFYKEFTNIPVRQFSLYKFKENIPNMFEKPNDITSSLSDLLEKYDINLLVMTTKEKINDVNFYLNGMKKKKCENITYALNDSSLFATKDSVIDLIEKNKYDGIIIDYDISLFTKTTDIKNTLSSIDAIIKNISDASKEKDYTFIISSLFGMHAQIMDGVVQKVVDFSGKVPCIYQSNLFTKGDYSLNSGNIYALSQTFLTNIDDKVKSNKLVHKLNKVEKMLSKK